MRARPDVFESLADPTRREILRQLAEAPAPVEAIATRFSISRPAISKHLRKLRDVGLVSCRPAGRSNIYHAELDGLTAVRDWIDAMWRQRLALLKRLSEGDS